MLCVFGFNVWKNEELMCLGEELQFCFLTLKMSTFPSRASDSRCDEPLVTLSRLSRNAVSESESARNPAQLGFGSIHTHG